MYNNSQHVNMRWWKAEEKHTDVFAVVNHIESNLGYEKTQALTNARLYSNSNLRGLTPSSYMPATSAYPTHTGEGTPSRIRFNVVASVIDTLTAKIAKNRPKVTVLPSGGDYDIQQRAKKLEKFIKGVFYGCDIYHEAAKSFVDMCVFGTGVMRVVDYGGELYAERVLPHELYVDAEEAVCGDPRQIHRKREMNRDVLIEMFPEFEQKIKAATKLVISTADTGTVTDNVTVIESWHLPSAKGAGDGRHTICVDTVDLLDEEYDYSDFPFVFIKFKEPLIGFWGKGIAEELTGIQLEINKLLHKIQKSFHLLSNPMVFVPSQSVISRPHINNDIGVIIPFSGPTPPNVVTHRTVHPEVSAHLQFLIKSAYEIIGVSQLSAASRKPDGLDSGVAIREYNEIESERFALVSRAWERFFVQLADKFIRYASDMYSNKRTISGVVVKGDEFIETIDWKNVNLADEKFVVQLQPSSILPETKSGKIQYAMDLLQMGAISTVEFRDILEIPDLESSAKLERAPREYIKKIIDDILDTGKITEPDAHDNLEFALQYAIQSLNLARIKEVPQNRIDALEDYISRVSDLLNPPTPEAAPLPMPGMPISGAGAAPQQGTGIKQLAPGGMVPQGIPPGGMPGLS